MINEAIDSYFETKQITENDIVRNGNVNLTQTPLCMLETSILRDRISQNNTYLYSCISQSVTQMEVEFIRFKNWVSEIKNTKCKQELSQVLFPVFCHLYLETVSESCGQNLQSAIIFFKRHQSCFTRESLRDIMKDLGNVHRKEDIENKPLVKAFRSAKCELKLSSTSAARLKNYISNCDEPTVLLNVFNSWFVIEDDDNNVREDDDPAMCPETEIIMGQQIESNSPLSREMFDKNENGSDSEVEQNDGINRKDAPNFWVSAFKCLRNCTPKASPLLLLEINEFQNVSCGSVCYPSKLVAVGSMKSDIKLFSFSDQNVSLPQSKSLPIKINIPNYDTCSNYVNVRMRKEFSILRGHSGSISAVKLLRDPEVLLSTSHDTTLRAWRREDLSCAAVYRGHNSPIWGLDISALNLYIATASQDKTVRLWTLDKTYPLRLYVGHHNSVTCVKFHPNGIYLASGSTDKTVRLFSVIDGKMARLFTGHTGPIHCLSFSPDGQYLASAGDASEVIVWNLALGVQYCSMDTESHVVCDLSWNLDSSVMAITFLKQNVFLLYIHKISKDNKHEIIGKYELPDHKLISGQFLQKNNLVVVGVL